MKIITLMEDTVGKEGALAEHGLCLYLSLIHISEPTRP